MTMHPSELALNEYVDDALPRAERVTIDDHLRTCERCRRTVEDLRRITDGARALAPMTPPDAAWGRIRAGVAPRDDVRARALPKWLAAAAAIVIAVSGGWYVSTHRSPAPQPAASTAPAPDAQMVAAEFQQATEHYQKAITGLEQITKSDSRVLDPQTAAAVQKGLSTIDQAIDESSAAIKQQPASEPAQQSLLENFRTKLALLEDTVALINEMRKGNEAGAAKIASGLKQNKG